MITPLLLRTLSRAVPARGIPPESFLVQLLTWGVTMPRDIVRVNSERHDVMPLVGFLLSATDYPPDIERRAALLEILRVLAGLESSWNWREGVDRTNARSQRVKSAEETGIFQVSFDSLALDSTSELRDCIIRFCGVVNVDIFIPTMKSNHVFALEYCARLLRHSYKWDGPIRRGEMQAACSVPCHAAICAFLSESARQGDLL